MDNKKGVSGILVVTLLLFASMSIAAEVKVNITVSLLEENKALIKVMKDGSDASFASVQVLTPSGKIYNLICDRRGSLILLLQTEGTYEISSLGKSVVINYAGQPASSDATGNAVLPIVRNQNTTIPTFPFEIMFVASTSTLGAIALYNRRNAIQEYIGALTKKVSEGINSMKEITKERPVLEQTTAMQDLSLSAQLELRANELRKASHALKVFSDEIRKLEGEGRAVQDTLSKIEIQSAQAENTEIFRDLETRCVEELKLIDTKVNGAMNSLLSLIGKIDPELSEWVKERS